MTLESDIYKGARAKEVIENEAFIEAMAAIKNEVTKQWINTSTKDQDAREKLWLMLKLTEKFESVLQTTLESGKLAKINLEQESRAQRLRKAW